MPEIKKDPLVSFVEATNKEEGSAAITPVEPAVVADTKIEAPPIVETKIEAPKVEIPKVEIKEELIDLDIPDTVVTTTPEAFDFQSLIKDMGAEVKTKDELVLKFKELNKTPEDPFKGLPDNLRKAVEFAKQGGDFLQLLKVSQVDYSQIDPVVLYENQIRQQITDQAKAQEYLDSLSPLAKEVEGQRLKTQYIQWQESQEKSLLADLQNKATLDLARKAENEQRLRETVNKVDSIEGFKVKSGEKEKFIKEVTDGSLTRELFMDDRGNFDYGKMFRVRFLAKHFDSIQKHYGERIKNATKREVVEGLTNAEVQISSVRPEGEPQKFDSPLDHWISVSREKK
jgi:hypothetical protein